jgi:long-chain acyl-CoA synthetase
LLTRPWQQNYDYTTPITIRYPKFPVQNFLHIAASQCPSKVATDFFGSEMTYSQVRTQVLCLANSLLQIGVKKGDRIGLALPNCPQYLIAYYAILSAGAIVVNLNPYYTHDELKFMLENTKTRLLITFDAAMQTMRPLGKELGLTLIVTRVTDYAAGMGVSSRKDLELEEGWHHFSDLIENCSRTQIPRIELAASDVALIQFTGGTTGLPKGAQLTHGNIVAATLQAVNWGVGLLNFTAHEKRNILSIIPYFHIYGNVSAMNWATCSAATQILMPRFEIDEVLGTIKRMEQIFYFPAVPTMITAIVNNPKASDADLAQRIRLINSGGAPMPAELIQKVKDLGILFGEGWGMSETAALGTCNPLLSGRTGSIGVPVMDNDIRLVDLEEGTHDVPQGEPGEILIKGPTVMQGYWENHEETRLQMSDGWLRTGDIAQADEDGYFYIVDRKKDMIIAGGFNIYPREVDEVLYQHPKVSEAVTVGVPDEYRGETVKAFIVTKPGEALTEKEIIDFCRTKLAAYKVPKLIEFRESIPKSAVGKILRKTLQDEEKAKLKKKTSG